MPRAVVSGTLIGLVVPAACGPGKHSAGTPSPRRYFTISRRKPAWQGTGFVTACLRAMSAQVRSLEVFAELADAARRNLAEIGMRDVEVADADVFSVESGARCGAIAVTGSLPHYDARFERMLSLGGRLFVVVGEAPVMEARLVRRTAEDAWATKSLFETVIDPLVSAARPPRFTF